MNFIVEVEYITFDDSVGQQVIERLSFRSDTFEQMCSRLKQHERYNITRVVIRSVLPSSV